MNRPTPLHDQLDWHRRTLAGERVPRVEDEPECGWFSRQFVKNGPRVPVRIYLEQVIDPETGELDEPEVLRCEVLGQAADPVAIWPFCRAISEADFHDLTDKHIRDDLMMRATHAPIDLTENPTRPPKGV
ncbi:hypothetical protein [Maritimibacter sp. DP1N21-5]|uniref:hypothetical protein n=1 Tax=Maritimibacter sp. DP1N21-5 TaxID=2836867 RepID=UPI001C466E66|nr:hypothetical protein [Maritimibacter sp. DP1N21-5]MBV7408735.1 hypothetical protein [Maritimibacter sp. DP1N21-5]